MPFLVLLGHRHDWLLKFQSKALSNSYGDAIREVVNENMIYFVLGFILITIYVAINMGKFNLLEQRVSACDR